MLAHSPPQVTPLFIFIHSSCHCYLLYYWCFPKCSQTYYKKFNWLNTCIIFSLQLFGHDNQHQENKCETKTCFSVRNKRVYLHCVWQNIEIVVWVVGLFWIPMIMPVTDCSSHPEREVKQRMTERRFMWSDLAVTCCHLCLFTVIVTTGNSWAIAGKIQGLSWL